jgi:hypothetical protein
MQLNRAPQTIGSRRPSGASSETRATSTEKEPAMYIGFGMILLIVLVIIVFSMMRRSRV